MGQHTNQAPHRTTQASSSTAPSSTGPQAARAFTRKEKVPTAIVIGGGPSGLISARRLAAAGIERARDYTWEASAAAHAAIYASLAGDR